MIARLCALAACAAGSAALAAPAEADYRNVTAGGLLRPGIYGRIEVRKGPPPPVVHERPVVVTQPLTAVSTAAPTYLYVPPGQLRRWDQHCHKWSACGQPVLFVRVDDSPSRLGDWKRTQRPAAAGLSLLEALDRFAP